MKIVLVNHQDSTNVEGYSGTPYFMTRAIKNEFDVVKEYDLFEAKTLSFDTYENGIVKTLKPIGQKLSQLLAKSNVNADFVIFQGGNSSLPYLDCSIPKVFWHDSTWSSYLQAYNSVETFNDFKRDCKHLYAWDKAVLDKCDLLVYSSEYVAEFCINNYQINKSKVKVIPFGANLIKVPSEIELEEQLKTRLNNPILNFTFIGKDWKRKGLLNCFRLVSKLNELGITSQLHVIGCRIEVDILKKSPYVIELGYLNKALKSDLLTLENTFRKTHFMLHPAISEPFGIVLCEANAYGIPIIGANVEGLQTIVKQGKNGFLFNNEIFVEQGVSLIKELFENFDNKYPKLFFESLIQYRQRLNWSEAVKTLKSVLAEYLK